MENFKTRGTVEIFSHVFKAEQPHFHVLPLQ